MSYGIMLSLLALLPVSGQQLRVGVIHKPSLVVAFYNSQNWAQILKSMVAELDAANKAGDTRKAEELEKWGQEHQELAHKQLSGEAPIDNILEALAAGWPEIARKGNVAIVVVDLPYADKSVETVDVTGQLLDYLNSSERVRKMVADLQQHKGPMPKIH